MQSTEVTVLFLFLVFSFTAVWLFSIWAGAGVARNKGRSAWLGAIFGALFSVGGLILMWLVPANREVVARRELELKQRLVGDRHDDAGVP